MATNSTLQLPKVTVVTVVRNGQSVIEETILSVLDQDYPNIEYIVVDGDSKDDTCSIIQRYRERIARFVSEPDNGIYDAMNKAAEMASGEWIVYMNAGDAFYEKASISRLLPSLRSDADVIFAGVEEVLQDDVETRRFQRMPSAIERIWKQMPTSHQATFVRANVQRAYKFDTRYVWCADHDLLARLYRDRKTFVSEPCLFCVFDCGGGRSRDPVLFIKERWRLSAGLVAWPKRLLHYGYEWCHCSIWGRCVRFLKQFLSPSMIVRLRRLRGTSGVRA
ncbi:MAG: glycosyltransferase family 2 protein [Cyanobacteria bacterium J06614_10]